MTNVRPIDTAREARAVAEINELHAVQEGAVKRAIRIGELLTECKAAHKGVWAAWVANNLTFSQQMANRYMRAYEGSKTETEVSVSKTVKEAAKRAPSQRETKAAKEVTREPVEVSQDEYERLVVLHDAAAAKLTDEEVRAVRRLFTTQVRKHVKAQLDAEFDARVELKVCAIVNERVEQERARLREAQAEVDAHLERLHAQRQQVCELMDFEDFQKIRSALHPDKLGADTTEEDKRKRGHLFDVFTRMERNINPRYHAVADLRQRGWQHLKPQHKPKTAKAPVAQTGAAA